MSAGPRGPTAGLTLERLAALLYDCPDLWTAGLNDPMDRAIYAQAAAWLLPRLGSVAPILDRCPACGVRHLGAPCAPLSERSVSPGAAARLVPTDAMIDAAFRSFYGYVNASDVRTEAESRERASIAEALRAALAAAPEKIVTDAGGRALDHEWLRLCELLPEGSPERDAANSMRLDGESPVPYIEAYIDYLRRNAPGTWNTKRAARDGPA